MAPKDRCATATGARLAAKAKSTWRSPGLAVSRAVRNGDRPVPRSMPPRPAYGARTVGHLVPRVTRAAFEKFGFSTATLITEWPTIVGNDLARLTAPERVKWPRVMERSPDDDADAVPFERRREGATLFLRVDGPRALEIQYKTRLIMDRINAFFGWAAVGTVRIVQAPLHVTPAHAMPSFRTTQSAPPAVVGELAETGLRDAFARLYDGVAQRR